MSNWTRNSRRNSVTFFLILINLTVWGLQIVPGSLVTEYLGLYPAIVPYEPWRLITSGFAHNDGFFSDPTSVLHILFNMYSLFIFGQVLEPMLGRLRFLVLYLTAILGGGVLVIWMNSPFSWTVGASGGIFGLMAAYFVLMRAIGGNASQVMGLIAINLVFSFLPGVSWQGHIGGLVAGGAVALVMSKTRSRKSQPAQVVGVAIVIGLLLVAAYLRVEQLTIIPLGIPSLPNVVE